MDTGKKKEIKSNPIHDANLLSRLTFFHTHGLFRNGFRKDLEDSDVYEIVNSYKAKSLGNRLEEKWKEEIATKRHPNIARPLLKLFGLRYVSVLIPYLLMTFVLIIAKPLLLGQILDFFNSESLDEFTRKDILMCSLALSVCVMTYTVMHHFGAFDTELTDLKAKAALCSLIYNKSLRLRANTKNASGQAITLMTKDVITVEYLNFSMYQTLIGPLNVIAMTVLMYQQIGLSSIAGTAFLILLIPLQGYLGSKVTAFKLKTSEKTDERIQTTQEVLDSLQVIKMYCWQNYFCKYINKIRSQEIWSLKMLYYLKAASYSIGQISSKLALYICIITYVYMGYHITSQKAYVVIECLGTLHLIVMYNIPKGMAHVAEFCAALRRISNFLLLPEVSLERKSASSPQTVSKISSDARVLLAAATVTNSDDGGKILADVNLEFHPGLCAITGPVGCGKSTLMQVVLGEAVLAEGSAEVRGIVSYASQQAWVFPGTIRQNVVFCEQFNRERYETVIKICGLQQDLRNFGEGDMTSVADCGLNLSGGQRARISLARVVYKEADIYLLDDSLSSIDTHISSLIFRECVKKFLKGKICIFATQQPQFLQEADSVVILNEGRVKFFGTYDNLKNQNEKDEELSRIVLKKGMCDDKSRVESQKEETKSITDPNQLESYKKNVYEETKENGSVKKKNYFMYFMSGGISMCCLVLLLAFVAQAAVSWTEFFISTWVQIEKQLVIAETTNATDATNYKDLVTTYHNMLRDYSIVLASACILTAVKTISLYTYCSRISKTLHSISLKQIIKAKMVFFNTNLSGNILNRFSRDLGVVDEIMPTVLFEISMTGLMLLSVFIVSSIVNQLFVIPSVVFAILLVLVRRLYIPVGRSLKRLQGTTRSAVVGIVKSTFDGLTTIRASQAQDMLSDEFSRCVDHYNSAFQMTFITTRAFVYYCDLLCSLFISTVILTFPLIKSDVPAGEIGLALTQSLALTGFLQWGIRQWAELEIQMTSAERILQYTKIDAENEDGENPPESWPNSGRVNYIDVNLRYSADCFVLKDISFEIKSREKIGIVGRTGAGKSSIISTLFKLYEYEGTIKIDDLDISTIPIDTLRSKIAIIPQNLVLFAGTVRSNLDPNDVITDQQLWDVLREVNMTNSIRNLEDVVTSGGNNFSTGQRQLICLARALLRNTVILVLDEATANVDPETDKLLHGIIRQKFCNCTVITIAHRLHTVMDSDRIMVVDSGRVIEFDGPQNLLRNSNGLFYAMAKDAGLVNL